MRDEYRLSWLWVSGQGAGVSKSTGVFARVDGGRGRQAAWRYWLMSPPQVRVSPDRWALLILDDAAIVGGVLAEAAVGPVGVVVLEVVAVELFEVGAVPDESAVQELAAHAANPAFGIGVRDRGTRWRADDRRAVAP